jgi:hypothetical protein
MKLSIIQKYVRQNIQTQNYYFYQFQHFCYVVLKVKKIFKIKIKTCSPCPIFLDGLNKEKMKKVNNNE